MAQSRLKTFVVILERTVRQAARIELQAPTYSEAEESAKLLAKHDATVTWDQVGHNSPLVVSIQEWNTQLPNE